MALPKFVRCFINSPRTTDEQRVRFAILCAMEVCQGPKYAELRQWAEKWLSGEDRSEETISRRLSRPTRVCSKGCSSPGMMRLT